MLGNFWVVIGNFGRVKVSYISNVYACVGNFTYKKGFQQSHVGNFSVSYGFLHFAFALCLFIRRIGRGSTELSIELIHINPYHSLAFLGFFANIFGFYGTFYVMPCLSRLSNIFSYQWTGPFRSH